LAEAAAPSDSVFFGAVYKYTYLLTHSHVYVHYAIELLPEHLAF